MVFIVMVMNDMINNLVANAIGDGFKPQIWIKILFSKLLILS